MNPTKPILTLFLTILLGSSLGAQSYLPFPDQWTCHYSYPDSAYEEAGVISVRVDSIFPAGTGTTYLFNQIVRPIAPGDTVITCGGDWISTIPSYSIVYAHQDNAFGSHCTVYPGGRAEFHTQAGDTFVIETHASVGDSWTFRGSSGVTAEVIAHGLEQFLGVTDSVKTIRLSDGGEIALSKTYGMVEGLAFLPLHSLVGGERISRDLTLWGIKEIGLGKDLPGFEEVFGMLEEGDMYQSSTFSYGSSGTNSIKNEFVITSTSVDPYTINYEVTHEFFSVRENYIFSGGSSLDSTYQAPRASSVFHQASDYPYLELGHGEPGPTGISGRTHIPTMTDFQDDGRILREVTLFTDYDPCADVFYYFPFDYYSKEVFEEGLGMVYSGSGGNGYSSSYSFGCYNTAFVGVLDNCMNLPELAGIDTGGPQDPGGLPVGVWGNGDGNELWLVPGDAANFLRVWDATGRKVMEMPLKEEDSPYTLDVSNWRPGVYVFSVERAGGQQEVFRTGLIK